ncbi:NahK/ErcS family hybrid sensor histidine kinase/response regulator [Azospirillum sp. SYSU D00513]|uniref:hybrid sensor histidine kinase/response regulator n=1 Tax=Azospirillum sp. SYSU D00513 TaxID=2812561 RepID=UPI001A96C5E4|nr:NahK/ErcS family hybrid sensor histidine kinase/response regulator [Azospirillum sp. SYSU D00513]
MQQALTGGMDRQSELARENAKLRRINQVLMDRVERSMDFQGNAFSLFQTAVLLENRVHERTQALETALREGEHANRELRRATEDAETAKARLSEAIRSIREGFAFCGPDDRLVLCNNRYREIWRLGDAAATGMTFEEIVRRAATDGMIVDAMSDPEDWVRRRMASHRAPGEPFVLQFRDGRWLQISERRTEDGGIVGIYTDITEIKISETRRREHELAETSALLQATLDNLSQGVSVFDASQRLVAWNNRFVELLGLPRTLVFRGTSLRDVMVSDCIRRQFTVDGSGHVRPIEPGRPLELEHEAPGGRVLEIRRNTMPDGGWVSTYTDITERRRAALELQEAKLNLERRVEERTAELRAAKAEAEQANLSKTKFLAAASHDLLQPLNAARVFMAALAERRVAPANRRLVDSTVAALEGVDELLTALLDISKLDAGVMHTEIGDFPIAELLSAMEGEHAMVAVSKGLRLTVKPCRLAVRSDPRLVGRILRNLISNAIRYTPSGRILVGCRRRGDRLLVGVWDTGVGIPADKQEEIFEEFRRLNDQGRDRGMGLGLAIVQRIARRLGHPLVVRSEHGRGSLFGIELPIGQDAAVRPARRPLPMLPRADGMEGAAVLVIDNEVSILEGMAALLGGWGCQVAVAATAEEALERAAQDGRPDLIVADYHLDEGRIGLDAIAAVQRACGGDLPGIVVTADHTAEVQAAVKAAGCHLLNKPLKAGRLRSLMAHLLAKARTARGAAEPDGGEPLRRAAAGR